MSRGVIPEKHAEQIRAELGTKPDPQIAREWSDRLGIEINRQVIFQMRRRAGVQPYKKKTFTKPPFRGKLEDAHPEVRQLLGRVPMTEIARHYNVSRSCVRSAADRLGVADPANVDYTETIEQILEPAQAMSA